MLLTKEPEHWSPFPMWGRLAWRRLRRLFLLGDARKWHSSHGLPVTSMIRRCVKGKRESCEKRAIGFSYGAFCHSTCAILKKNSFARRRGEIHMERIRLEGKLIRRGVCGMRFILDYRIILYTFSVHVVIFCSYRLIK